MKRLLPIIFLLFASCYLLVAGSVFAQSAQTTPAPITIPQSSDQTALPDNTWIKDAEVTFVGKTGARAGAFLDWTLSSNKWSEGGGDSLSTFWVTVRNIVYYFFILLIIVSAFIFIISRGRNITVQQLIPRFILIVVLVTFSFALIQILYIAVDIIQGFFLSKPGSVPPFISQSDLLSIGFDYEDFIGYRLSGIANDESAFMSLLLIKLTTITYYLMAGILILRKIILWFFIFMSPIFPLLLLYSPVRNTAKIWMGEFFRWLLYGPIFAVLLAGLVALWKSPGGIPLTFTTIDPLNPLNTVPVYPTAINILLGGPGQQISAQNSVNLPETFALYVVALIMLWVVILLPFLLLKIFLDSFREFSFKENSLVKKISSGLPFSAKPSFVSSPPIAPLPQPLPPSHSTGMARSIPFVNRVSTDQTTSQSMSNSRSSSTSSVTSYQNQTMQQAYMPILRATNLTIPTMRDIARYETHTMSSDVRQRHEVTQIKETLERIANPVAASAPADRQQYAVTREKLIEEKGKGNPVASAILTAATSVASAKTSVGTAPGAVQATQSFPVANRVQTVSLGDYEAVKKMWQENYHRLETPKTADGKEITRTQWVKEDTTKITQAINLLLSHDSQEVKEGMQMVSDILPFLLIGGFSQTEVIAYLKAKLEAAKSVSGELEKKEDEESTMVDRTEKKDEKLKELQAEEEVPLPVAVTAENEVPKNQDNPHE